MRKEVFSRRFGYAPPISDLGPTDMPIALRNGLWNAVYSTCLFSIYSNRSGSLSDLSTEIREYCQLLWTTFYSEPIDQIGSPGIILKRVRERFFGGEFHHVYDFLEFTAANVSKNRSKLLTHGANAALCRERASYRFAGRILIQVADEIEAYEITEAIESTALGVRGIAFGFEGLSPVPCM